MRLSILSNEELIDSICSSQEDAQFVFQNPELVSRLDLYNLLKAIGNHNDLAEIAIKSGLCEKLDPDHLILIGRHHLNIAKLILNQTQLLSIILQSPIGLVQLGKRSSKIAKYILKNCDNTLLTAESLCQLVQIHDDMDAVNYIFQTPQLRDKLSKGDLVLIGTTHAEVALHILNSTKLRNELNSEDLGKLGKSSTEIAMLILKDNELLDRMHRIDLQQIGFYNSDVIMYMLKNEEICCKLNSSDLYNFAYDVEEIAEYIFNQPKLVNQLEANDQRHLKEQYYLKFKLELQDLSSYRLFWAAVEDQNVAQQVIDNEDLYNKLSSKELCSIGSRHPLIGEQMLTVPGVFAKLLKPDLMQLCLKNYGVIQKVHQNKDLVQDLFNSEEPAVNDLRSELPAVTRFILENKIHFYLDENSKNELQLWESFVRMYQV